VHLPHPRPPTLTCLPSVRGTTPPTPPTPSGGSSPRTYQPGPGADARSPTLGRDVDAIRYLDRTGCQWDALPADVPHPKLIYHYFKTWTTDGTLNHMHNSLREQVREQIEGRDRQPTAALVDSRSIRGADTVARATRGYDAGKHVNGRKRHIAVDTCGLLLAILITGGHVQDRDAAKPLLWALHACFPGIRLVWADGGYAGKLVDWATTHLTLTIQIVTKLAGQTGFVVLHRRWAVERTFSWINRCRRTVRDYERLPQHHAAMVQWSMIIIMTRRLARHQITARAPSTT
jgi:putative transposase